MMKKFVIVFYLLVSMTVVAQPSGSYDEVNDCLRFLPTRVTNHVHTVREYKLPTDATSQRELIQTTHYNRQGHRTYYRHRSEMPDSSEYTYDSHDRLVRWQHVERHWDNDSQRMVWSNLIVENLDYTPDGLVNLDRLVIYDRVNSKIDTTVITYRLIHLERSGWGVTECDYAYYERESLGEVVTVQTDTCRFRREYDDKGRLVRQTYTDQVGSSGLDNYEERYAYDSQGRVLYEITRSYGGCDTMTYRYNVQGNVVEKSGKSWVQGIKSDIIVRFSPDGFPLERTEVSYPPEEDESAERSVTRTWYDAKGSIIRAEHPDYTLERDVVYWE